MDIPDSYYLNNMNFAKMSLRNSMLEMIFDTLEDGVVVIDRKAFIKFHNKLASELLGIPETHDGHRLTQFLPDLKWDEFFHSDRLSFRTEVEVMYPQYRRLQLMLLPLEGRPESLVLLRDITIQLEESSREIENQSMRMVSLLAAGVAHEIGNPLNNIYINLQLMQQEVHEGIENTETMLSMLQTAQNEVTRLDGIIRRFLSAMRPTKPNFTRVDLREVVANTLQALSAEIEKHQIHVSADFKLFQPINGDKAQIQQVLMNLVKNALQATEQNGNINIHCYEDDNFVICDVKDTGCGISTEEIQHVFDPFHTTKKAGTGLGLFIAERIMREHGGSISIESQKGEGALFRLRFPLEGRIRMRQLVSHETPEMN